MTEFPDSPDAASDDPLIGQMVGDRYRVLSVLGDGGMGTVYLAEHVLMEKRVALKVLHPSLAVVSSVMDRFQKEAIALARIEHPNVVSATDFGKLINGSYYLALEYVVGRNLGEELQARGALPLTKALSIAAQIARALEAAHSHGIVHRDLKPHNIMLTTPAGPGGLQSERVKVLDFGLAKLRSRASEGSQVGTAGRVFGTPHYMAPEQITGGEVDGRTDLYSLGVILHEMLSGSRPFDNREVREILGMQLNTPPPALPEATPAAVQDLVRALMAKSLEDRPVSAAVVVASLETLQRALAPSVSWWKRAIPLGRFQVPAWTLVLPAATFVLPFALADREQPRQSAPKQVNTPSAFTTPPAPAETAELPPLDSLPALLSDAEFGKEEAMKKLSDIPEARRTADMWLALGQGHVALKQGDEALDVFRLAVHHYPELKEDERISRLVRLLCGTSKTSGKAVTIAAETLGARGVDVLFSVWSETKHRTAATAAAERFLDKEEVLARGSDAVQIAMALRKVETCEEARQLVLRATKVGDTRSLRPLRKLRSTKGCGPQKRDDCFPCLREPDVLSEALEEAGKREGARY